MSRHRLKVIKRPGCDDWYIRPTEDSRSKWVRLSDNKAEAERMACDYERQRMLKRVEGVNLQADIAFVIERYLREKFATTLTTRKSQQRYAVVILKFKEFVKNYTVSNVSDVGREIVSDYLNQRNYLIAGKTWNAERAILYNFFKFCLNNNWIVNNPVAKINPKRVEQPHIEHLNAEEAQQLLEHIKCTERKLPYYELIVTLLYTGMRVNEATHLTKQDALLDKNMVVVKQKILRGQLWTPKTKTTRYVPIPDILRPVIEKQMATKSELLFANSKDNLLKDRAILAKMKKWCIGAGLKIVHTHSLRHTFTSVSSEQGIPELAIQNALGHKSADMTARYRHLRPGYFTDKFKSFGYGQETKAVI